MMVTLRSLVGIYTEYWTMVLGIILMLLIFFLPQGLLGFLLDKLRPEDTAARPEEV
ncbi:MAG: hypothetical protein HQK59_17460 [Deltaproteobacteria bacterium]|nr:hypothetical protein [Deltaproteobacteria bacterium]